MYRLELTDGTVISNLNRINSSTFEVTTNDSSIYNQLSDYNLSFAILYNEDDDKIFDDVLINYTLQNYSFDGTIVRFRLAPTDTLEQVEQRRKRRK